MQVYQDDVRSRNYQVDKMKQRFGRWNLTSLVLKEYDSSDFHGLQDHGITALKFYEPRIMPSLFTFCVVAFGTDYQVQFSIILR